MLGCQFVKFSSVQDLGSSLSCVDGSHERHQWNKRREEGIKKQRTRPKKESVAYYLTVVAELDDLFFKRQSVAQNF